MNNVKLIIVGATGYIGKPLYEQALSKLAVIGTSTEGNERLISLDLSHPHDFDYACITPDTYVAILAAISSPDVCAHEHAYAWRINVTCRSEERRVGKECVSPFRFGWCAYH